MQLIVPFAAPLSDAGRAALRSLQLPHLQSLLTHMTETFRDDGDALSFSPPHERSLGRALGFTGADGRLPFGAWLAQHDGIATGDAAWALLTPAHWEVATDHVRLADPAALALDEASSRTLLDVVRPLFDEEGMQLVWGAAERWYVAHPSLDSLATASLDRVIGRQLDAWLPEGPEARRMRRLQNEVQMLLHNHPINAEREDAGQLTMNSFWLSGCGIAQQARSPAPTVDGRLRAPALAEDWAAWTEAWRSLDEDLGRLGQDSTLVLCGERSAVQFDAQPRSWWRRMQGTLRGAAVLPLLESL
ncbi:MAG TPA: hypothetical protein VFP68_04780 [Burkholderiaceae bacterium]|nr:hypothetical protein [Burkholderiaceae bacterium]